MNSKKQIVDAQAEQITEQEFAPTLLGSVIELTCVYADGPNRDGGYVQGNNYSYQ